LGTDGSAIGTVLVAADREHKKATLRLDAEEYIVLRRSDYDRLARMAKLSEAPPLPRAGADGHFPAIAYGRASIARSIVRDRTRAGLSQKELAEIAGVRVETLCWIEKARNTPSTATVAKIDHALRMVLGEDSRRRRSTG
jgi:DNA-binding XRE family transcriptional regulator